MQENPISNSLSKTDSNEASNPIRSLMPFRYGPLCYAIVDVEIGLTDHRIHDIGALRYDGAIFHKASKEELLPFLERVKMACKLFNEKSGKPFLVEISLGIAEFRPNISTDIQQVISLADQQLYEAKKHRKKSVSRMNNEGA